MTEPRHHPIRVAAGGFLALAAAMGIGRFVYTPILPYMVEETGLGAAAAGWIASANFIGYLLGALAAALLPLPGARWWWFVAGLSLSAATTAAMGLAEAAAAFAVLRFLGGAASAFVLVFSSTVVLERLAQAGRPGLSAVHFGGVGAGIAASALFVPSVSAAGAGWQALWFASGLSALLLLGAVLVLVPLRPDAGPSPAAARGEETPRGLSALIAAYGLFGFGYVITATFISAMARETEALRPYESQLWLAVGLAAVPSVALWAAAGRRMGNRRAFALACLVEAAGVALSVLGSGPVVVAAAAALLGGTFMGITALGLIQARAVAAANPQRAIALMTAAFGLGQVIGPGLAGAMYDATGSLTAPSLIASVTLVAAAGLVSIAPAAQRNQKRG